MPQDVASPLQYAVTITEEAVAAAKRLLVKADHTTAELGLRIKVDVGGCAGLRYQLYFDDLPPDALPMAATDPVPDDEDEGYYSADEDEAPNAQPVDRDSVMWSGGLAVLIDAKSGPYIQGSVIDFAETLNKYGFTIENPNAQSGCACGDSFH